jgi:lipopolysaccharide/colanic/teichoic acid biosynthesis glycosyltransferase
VATSERILTTINSAADLQRVSPYRSFIPSQQPVWRRFLTDFVTIALVLTVTPALFGLNIPELAVQYPSLSPLVIALMITTLFAFVGCYPRHRTPLAIGDSEGLVRGITCAAVLVVIFNLGERTVPAPGVVLTGCVLTLVLAAKREIAHIFGGHKSSGLTSGRPHLFDGAPPKDEVVPITFDLHCEPRLPGDLLKRLIDLIAAGILLAVAMPLFLCVAALIKIDSRGPVFIRQRRIGRDGTSFLMWKFRSMHQSVARYERSPVSDADPRLTNVGRALRRLSIDELPQLLNVLHGSMSLVGPRPEMPFIVAKYGPRERLRLHATPGITGLWQISPARAMPIHQNLEFDLFYIESRNFFLDTAILLRTVTAVVRGIGAT